MSLPPAKGCCRLLMAENRPVLLLWRQEVRTGSELLMSFRFPKANPPRDVPLEPLGGWLSSVLLRSSVQVSGGQLCFWSAPKVTWTQLSGCPFSAPSHVGRIVCGVPATLFLWPPDPLPSRWALVVQGRGQALVWAPAAHTCHLAPGE